MTNAHLLLALLLLTPAFPESRLPSEHWWTVRTDTETPHIPWARPFAGGPIRTLFIVPASTTREVVELAQRVAMDVDAWVVGRADHIGEHWHYALKLAGGTEAERLAVMRQKLRSNYDLFVVGNVQWDLIPTELRTDILEQVAQGAGIVFVTLRGGTTKDRKEMRARKVDDGGYITRGVPLSLLDSSWPDPKPKTPVQTFRMGNGRAAEIPWELGQPLYGLYHSLTPPGPPTPVRLALQEYYYSLVARTAVWAAGRTGQVSLTSWPDGPLQIKQDAGRNRLELQALNDGDERDINFSVNIRDERGSVEASTSLKLKLKKGNASLPVDIPALPAGIHLIDCTIRSKGATLDWGTAIIEVESPVKLGAVRVSGDAFEVGESVRVVADLVGDLNKINQFRIDLEDETGRILSRASHATTPGRNKLSGEVTIREWSGPSMTLSLSLHDGVLERVRHSQSIFVRHKPPKDFRFMVWGWPHDGYVPYLERLVMRRYGFDIFYPYHWIGAPPGAAVDVTHKLHREGLLVAPYAQADGARSPSGIRNPCMTTTEYRKERRRQLGPLVKATAKYGIYFWSMGDEPHLDSWEVCFSPTCIGAFRTFLKKRFESVQALNQAWGLKFASWDDVTPVRRSDRPQPIGLQADISDGEKAMWVAHRLSMDEVFLNTVKLNADIVREHDSTAKIGMEGMYRTAPWWGHNFEKLFNHYNTLIPYTFPEAQDGVAMVRSFKKGGDVTGGIFGGHLAPYRDARNEAALWKTLFNSADLMFWWTAAGATGAVGGDLAPTWFFKRCMEPMKLIRNGLGMQVRHMERLHDGIAILFSRESTCASAINDDFPRTKEQWKKWEAHQWNASRIGWQSILEELGLQYEYITSKQAAALDPADEFKVLLLPYAQAMPDSVVQGIRSFVDRGGTVIADVRPGLFDELGMRLPSGSLDDVFGITRKRERKAVVSAKPLVDGTLGDITIKSTIPEVRVDGEVSAKRSRALGSAGDVPVFLTSTFGRGKAVLLNYLIDDLNLRRFDNREDSTVDTMARILEWAGVVPQLRVRTDGNNMKGLQVVRVRHGQTTILALIREGDISVESAVPGKLVFEESRHTYDVRKSEYLGEVKEVSFNLARGEAHLLTRLPYRIDTLSLQMADSRQGSTATAVVTLESAPQSEILHVFRFEFTAPDGKTRPGMTKKVVTEKKKCSAEFLFAWNDPLGEWNVRVTDVATGRAQSQSFNVVAGVPRH